MPTITEHLAAADAILTRAEADGRGLDEAEQQTYDRTLATVETMRKRLDLQSLAERGGVRLEAGTNHGAAEYVTRTAGDPYEDLGADLSRADSPSGLIARAHSVLERTLTDVPDSSRSRLGALLSDSVGTAEQLATAELVIAGSDPRYRRAFDKVLRNPTHGHLEWDADESRAYRRTSHARAALSLTGANGGFLVPFTLDPTIVVSNAGAANPFRSISRIATTSTNSWNGVQSPGVAASWLPEGTVAADASPTFAQLTITPQKAAAWLFGSYEILQDTDISEQLPTLLADAKNVLEGAAFATGAGSGGVPKGVVTAATTTVTTAAVATYAVADVYALHQSLPPRYMSGRSLAFVGSRTILNKTRLFDTAGGSSYWVTMGDGTPPRLLGSTLAEASAMATATTTGSKILVYGDFDRYQIVDRVGMSVLYEPMVKDQATARPTGQGGWFAFWRVGADVLDASAFRTLVVQ